MYKKIINYIILCSFILILSGCSITRKPLNNASSFDNLLTRIEVNIQKEQWALAQKNADKADKAWRSAKPILQIDIDHDYVNDIEDSLIRLKGYIETQEKTDALITVRLIQDFWNTIGEM